MQQYSAVEQMHKYNERGIVLVSKVILALTVLNLFFSTFIRHATVIDVYPTIIGYTYFSLYICMSILCLFTLILIRYKRCHRYFFTMYVGLLVPLSSLITFFDQYYFSHVLVYTSVVVLCAQFIWLPAKRMAKIFILQALLHSSLLAIYIGFTHETFLQTVYAIVLTIFGITISNRKSNLYYSLIQSQTRYRHQLQIEKQLTMQLQQMNTDLQQMALTDSLVQIPNRLAFKKECEMAAATNEQYGIVIIDIDYFKQYNDFYGHLHGDVVLQQVARILQTQAELLNGFVARWGGEEFVVLFKQMNMDRLEQACYALRTSINEAEIPHVKSRVAPFVTISMGATIWHTQEEHIEQVLQRADAALYDVKQTTRNNVKMAYVPH